MKVWLFLRMKNFISYLCNLFYNLNKFYFAPKCCERIYNWKIGEDHLLYNCSASFKRNI